LITNTILTSDQIFDLIVIGGGITGAGVARDAALRGLSCLLL
jgi:glycerol-3-phosphate dehydrogenase